jgi:diaminopimelate decarboxylase
MHIGSGIVDVENYLKAADRLLQIASHVRREVDVTFEFIDLGGGIGVPYKPEEKQVDLSAFISKLLGFLMRKIEEYKLGEPAIYLEPGRFLVAEAGVLLTRVTTLKKTPGRSWLGVDAGFNTLIRPTMYGSYHHIISASAMNEPMEKFDVYGPLCESGDIFARDRSLPRVEEGALLAIMNAGAYGFSMASRYNSRPLPAEVMVMDAKDRLIRERETLQDLVKGQK